MAILGLDDYYLIGKEEKVKHEAGISGDFF